MTLTLRYLFLFAWLIAAGLVGKAHAFTGGLGQVLDNMGDARPHMVWSYTFRDNGDPYNARAHRDYITCTYVGPFGEFTVHAENFKCPFVKMFSMDDVTNVIRHRPIGK